MKQKLLFFSILIEAALILFLLAGVYQKYRGSTEPSIAVIDKESVVFGKGELRYFYEPLPGSKSSGFETPSWLAHTPLYEINSDTLNDATEYQIQKPKGTYRIVTLGDSVAFGLYVNTSESYPETLERLLRNTSCKNKFEVINLGVPGYDIQYSLERFKRRGLKYNPDLVIWFLQQGNFSIVRELIQRRIERDYQVKDVRVALEAQEDIGKEVGEKNIVEYQSSFLDEFATIHKKEFMLYSFKTALWGEQEKRAKDFVEKNPLGHFYQSTLDLKKNDALFLDSHPDKKGHLLIAQDLSAYLRKNNIIPCD